MKQRFILLTGNEARLKEQVIEQFITEKNFSVQTLPHHYYPARIMEGKSVTDCVGIVCFDDYETGVPLIDKMKHSFLGMKVYAVSYALTDHEDYLLYHEHHVEYCFRPEECTQILTVLKSQSLLQLTSVCRKAGMVNHAHFTMKHCKLKPLNELTDKLPEYLRPIVELLCKNKTMTAAQIAKILVREPKTIESQMYRVYARLSVKNKEELLVLLEGYEVKELN
jgi:hypothetical protein